MACGCKGAGAKAMGASGFIHTASNGTKTETRSEIEARALVIRQGGSYVPKK